MNKYLVTTSRNCEYYIAENGKVWCYNLETEERTLVSTYRYKESIYFSIENRPYPLALTLYKLANNLVEYEGVVVGYKDNDFTNVALDNLVLLRQGAIKKNDYSIEDYVKGLEKLSQKERGAYDSSLSAYMKSGKKRNTEIVLHVGDVVLVDYGFACYDREVRYIHPGIVIAIKGAKMLVVPTKSGVTTYDDTSQQIIGDRDGVLHLSTAFINDAKWLNINRVLSVKGEVCEATLKSIKTKFVNLINL